MLYFTAKDYSAFTMIDVTKIPYEVVATYKNNEIKPHLFPSIIEQVAKVIIMLTYFVK